MGPRQNPRFIGSTGCVGAERNEITPDFDYPLAICTFLREDVTKNAALLLVKVIEAGPQFVENAARDECGSSQLGVRMLELLAGGGAKVLENADIPEPRVAFEILNALGCKKQKLLDFQVTGVPELTVML